MSYDVTGVSAAREYVPLAASVDDLPIAADLAAGYSSTARWSAVLVKDNGRGGLIVATYVSGKRQPR